MKGGKWSGNDGSGLEFEDDRLGLYLEEGPYTFNFDFVVGTKLQTQLNGEPATAFLGDLNHPFPGAAVNADGTTKPRFVEKNLMLGVLFEDEGLGKAFSITARSSDDLKIGKQILQTIRFK